MNTVDQRIRQAVKTFWQTRELQQRKQSMAGNIDQGSRGAATGGKQLDGFLDMLSELLLEAGVPEDTIFRTKKGKTDIPGFFRPMKEWDLIVIIDNQLIAAIELKSQVGSFGNNFNNRIEESLGNATDLWTAYRDGAFNSSPHPWLGYFMLLEKTDGSTKPVRVNESHFPVLKEFKGASYAERYRLFCEKLMAERLYSASCLILSDQDRGQQGSYWEPSPIASTKNFFGSLIGHLNGHLTTHR
ncbi:MAG: PaeR7I family type II restriction endonuclease [Candidatus Alcyoniella australis]|nr:PaeR7I family type II restriction endonuclease [Candidatus Alcyoniella australis]